MKGYKNWATACIAVTLTCVLAGCGQTSAGNAVATPVPSGTLNQVTNTATSVPNSATANVTTAARNEVGGGGSNHSVGNVTAVNVTPKAVAPGPGNFDIVSLTAPQIVTVEGVSFNPASEPSINGKLEPIVLKVHFVKVTQPIYLNLQRFELDNASANVGGVIAYYKYDGSVRRVFSNTPGSFPVSNTIVVSDNSTITLVCSVGTPVPPAKVDIVYNNMNLGSYSASTVGSYTLN